MNCLVFRVVILCVLLFAAGCSSLSPQNIKEDAAQAPTPWSRASVGGQDATAWKHLKFPGKSPSRFVYVRESGREAIWATAKSSVSMLRQDVRIEPSQLGDVRFSWKVPELMADADMAIKETDDCSVRVVLAFEGDRSRFSAKNAMLSELARLLTGEELPYATLMYVWSKTKPVGTVIFNPRTDRIRKIVVESGNSRLDRWVDYKRDIRADFAKAFGEEPGAMVSISLMTDSDNTKSNTQAWYGPLTVGLQK